MYGDNKFLHFIECEFVNLDTYDTIKFTNNIMDKNLLKKFLDECKKNYHPKIIFDYLRNQTLNEMKQFLNQIDNYNKFDYETKIDKLQQNMKNRNNTIEKYKKDNEKIINGTKNIINKCKEQEEENKELIKEINKLIKDKLINQKNTIIWKKCTTIFQKMKFK